MGNSPPSLSSHVMKIAPPLVYDEEAFIAGTFAFSQSSPCLIASPAQVSCMSLQRFGVRKLYWATVPAARSPASFVNGFMCAAQYALVALGGLPTTSSKKTIGVCFAA